MKSELPEIILPKKNTYEEIFRNFDTESILQNYPNDLTYLINYILNTFPQRESFNSNLNSLNQREFIKFYENIFTYEILILYSKTTLNTSTGVFSSSGKKLIQVNDLYKTQEFTDKEIISIENKYQEHSQKKYLNESLLNNNIKKKITL